MNGTADPALYRDARYGTSFSYQWTGVANGAYTVKLRFAEVVYSYAGARRFHTMIAPARIFAFALLAVAPCVAAITVAQARRLVEHAPDIIAARQRKGCPRTELLWANAREAAFQARNHCPRGATGMLGNYVVDLDTARVWADTDRREEIRSDRLGRLQQQFRRAGAIR